MYMLEDRNYDNYLERQTGSQASKVYFGLCSVSLAFCDIKRVGVVHPPFGEILGHNRWQPFLSIQRLIYFTGTRVY